MRRMPWLMLCSVTLGAPVACGSDAPSAALPPAIDSDRTSDAGSQFAGAWTLVAIERRRSDGELLAPVIDDRIGYLIYDTSGYMGVTIMSPDRPPYAGNTATDEEALAALTTYTAYFGGFTVHEADGYVTHHVEGSLNPNVTFACGHLTHLPKDDGPERPRGRRSAAPPPVIRAEAVQPGHKGRF